MNDMHDAPTRTVAHDITRRPQASVHDRLSGPRKHKVHAVLEETGEVLLAQATPRGNLSAHPRNAAMLDACAETIVAVLRLTGALT